MVNTISENTNYFNKVKVVEKSFKERQSELIGRFYDELWIANDMKSICTNHFHICQFELERRLFYKDKNWVKLKCKEHLKSFGSKRDRSFWCCDVGEDGKPCRYMKTFVKDSDGEILFVE